MECVGPEISGGNSGGVVDSRCSGLEIEKCGTGNAWAGPTTCAQGSCSLFTNATAVCGECQAFNPAFGYVMLSPCQEGASYAPAGICSDNGLGDPVTCGGTPSCCGSACQRQPATVSVATCAGFCGDGVVGPGEQCDGKAFGSATCASATLNMMPSGTLGCSAACQLDASQCYGGTPIIPAGTGGGSGLGEGGTGGPGSPCVHPSDCQSPLSCVLGRCAGPGDAAAGPG